MNIFVTGTGRSGTATFYHAASHCTNYTVGHESLAGEPINHEYPTFHIEVSSHLVVAIPLLRRRWPDALWIHLIRNRRECIESLVNNCWRPMSCYAQQWFQVSDKQGIEQVAAHYYDHVHDLCYALLPKNTFRFHLESARQQWPHCWDYMKMVGDFDSSIEQWSRLYNSRQFRGRDCYEERLEK